MTAADETPGAELHALFQEVFALQATLAGVMDRVHQEAGVTTPQHKVIRSLERLGSATVPDVAARLGVSRQFVQTICNELDARGWLAFRNNPRHKRSKLMELTPAGREAFCRARQNEDAIIERRLPPDR